MIPLYDLNPHHRFPVLTLLVIAANVLVMFWVPSPRSREYVDTVFQHGFVPKRVSELNSGRELVVPLPQVDARGEPNRFARAGSVRLSTDPADVYPTFITTMFLHGGWGHLLLNMWMLWIFGNNIEDRLGHFMYLCYYVIGGLVATMTHWAIDPQDTTPVVGASGAVAAVLGGYAITFPAAKVRTLIFVGLVLIADLPALLVLGVWFVLQVFSGVLMLQGGVQEPVAFWAHIGGFVAGIMLMPFLSLGASPPGTDWRTEAEDMFRFDDPQNRNE